MKEDSNQSSERMTEQQEAAMGGSISEFKRSAVQQQRGTWMLFGSAGMAGISLLGFLFAIFNRVDQLVLHVISTLPMIVAFGLLTGGRALTRGPRRVVIDDAGLQIEDRNGTKQHRWCDIGWATITATPSAVSQQRHLVLYDRAGKKVASLSEAFENFDDLVASVKSKVADQPGEVAENIQSRKARRSSFFMVIFASVMILLSASVAWMTYGKQRAARLLETEAVEGVATIDRVFVAPNGFTTRVEYTVTNAQGESASHNAEIESAYHAELTGADAKTIPVMSVPSEPGISRLRGGEIIHDDLISSPIGGYVLSALVMLMSLFFLGVAVLQWRGLDVDLDSKTGKISIKRFGEGQ
jgi:hypothetical protein